jgi:flavin reductase (DIM6/NTAB) family NADH-FMN oxidoreductase RutF
VWTHDVGVAHEPFLDLMAMLDGPAFVVTTQADGVPAGCLVGFASQLSVRPPRFLISLAKGSHTLQVASGSQHLAVHVLARRHRALAELFAAQTGHQIKKFERCLWRAGPQGMPILDDAIAWFVARTVDSADVGDHVIFLLEPVASWAPESDEDPLYLSDIEDLEPGPNGPADRTGFFDGAPNHVARRYGLRFTIGGI